MAVQADPYAYTPLPSPRHIRVLFLEPASGYNAPLRGSLQETVLPDEDWFEAMMDEITAENLAEFVAISDYTAEPEKPYRGGDISLYLRKAISKVRTRQSLLEYEALSYTWGSQKGDRQILCNGKEVIVTENCEVALRHLRQTDKPRALWVDAICINQDSVAERSQQVNLMGDLYKLSARTIIWLGKDDPKTSNLFWKMGVFASSYRFVIKNRIMHRLWRRFSTAASPYSQHLTLFNQFSDICSSKWFSRVWTLQEFVLSPAPILMYGYQEASWDLFLDFSEFSSDVIGPDFGALFSNRIDSRRDYYNDLTDFYIDRARNRSNQTTQGAACYTMLLSIAFLDATDPKDNIYGVRQLLLDINIRLPDADYSKYPREVFEETCRYVINYSQLLWVLGPGRSGDSDIGLPSWVPDWHLKDPHYIHLQYGLRRDAIVVPRRNVFATRGSLVHLPSIASSKSGELVLKGQKHSIVRPTFVHFPASIMTLWNEEVNHGLKPPTAFQLDPETLDRQNLERFLCLWQWLELSLAHGTAYSSEADLTNALEMILSLGKSNRVIQPKREQIVEAVHWFSQAGRDSANRSNPTELIQDFLRDKARSEFLAFVGVALEKSILFASMSGNLGISWADVQEGDVVALVAGSAAPLILRPNGNHYRYVGPAYIAGIMQGEAWEPNTKVRSLDTFVLI